MSTEAKILILLAHAYSDSLFSWLPMEIIVKIIKLLHVYEIFISMYANISNLYTFGHKFLIGINQEQRLYCLINTETSSIDFRDYIYIISDKSIAVQSLRDVFIVNHNTPTRLIPDINSGWDKVIMAGEFTIFRYNKYYYIVYPSGTFELPNKEDISVNIHDGTATFASGNSVIFMELEEQPILVGEQSILIVQPRSDVELPEIPILSNNFKLYCNIHARLRMELVGNMVNYRHKFIAMKTGRSMGIWKKLPTSKIK